MTTDIARIATWLQPQEILLDIEVLDRKHALAVMGEKVDHAQGLGPGEAFRALWRREQAASTGVGGGFAIPHAAVTRIVQPLTLFMRTKIAVPFDAPDRKPVSQLLAILAPVGGAKEDHLQLLAMVAQLFSDTDFRKQLDDAPDVDAAAQVFRTGIARVTAAST